MPGMWVQVAENVDADTPEEAARKFVAMLRTPGGIDDLTFQVTAGPVTRSTSYCIDLRDNGEAVEAVNSRQTSWRAG